MLERKKCLLLILTVFGIVSCTVILFTLEKYGVRFKSLERVIPDILNVTEPPVSTYKYKHVGGKPCSYHHPKRDQHYRLLSHWHEFATQNGIEYIITCGTLLGQHRNKDAIPWEHDVDVLVSERYYLIMNQSSQVRNFTQNKDDKFRLIAHPQFLSKVERERTRWNCQGKVVPSQRDACAFRGPMARLMYRSKYIDIYNLIDRGKILHDYGENENYHRTDYYPLVPCKFMNMTTWCPNNTKKILEEIYRNISRHTRVCKDGSWQRP